MPSVAIRTFGCKANQYDGERMRQLLEASGWRVVDPGQDPSVVVLNTCTVTARADAEARRAIRRLARDRPETRVVVAGCSAALHAARYAELVGEDAVVPGHDPEAVARSAAGGSRPMDRGRQALVQIDAPPLRHRAAGTRGWLRIQDGCDRQCSFCATRLARGRSRSRPLEGVVREARVLAQGHPELVLTGIHIGHWGRDLTGESPGLSLGGLVEALLGAFPEGGPRIRLGSVEATEVDDRLLGLLTTESEGGRLAPHLHMPLQSGSDRILGAMRRWHTRDAYRRRTLEIAEALGARGAVTESGGPILGLGADIITGFPGETDADHAQTVALVEELPFTYLHVFPFSPREGTPAAELAREKPVPQRVAAERARELRELGQAKGEKYLASRVGARVEVVVEEEGGEGVRLGLTGDYLRLPVEGSDPGGELPGRSAPAPPPAPGAPVPGTLVADTRTRGGAVRIRLDGEAAPRPFHRSRSDNPKPLSLPRGSASHPPSGR
jgi:threonylcarbamoyladenosine tRNA methylthiotransferase MtaB